MNIPYLTFPKTYVKKSNIENAGVGLFTDKNLDKYDWIGFYPGILDKRENVVGNPLYMMGTINNAMVISADENIKSGVHLVNEGNNDYLPNVWYIKLDNYLCLYFAGRKIKKGEELLTCYSCSYGNRLYEIVDSCKCTDPRCKKMNKREGTHRRTSLWYKGWREKLKQKKLKDLKDCGIL